MIPEANPQWARREDELLVELRNEGMQFTMIAQKLPGRSASACRNRYRKVVNGWQRTSPAGPFPKETEKKKSALEQWTLQTDKPTWREILELAKQNAEIQHRLRPLYTSAERVIKTDRPIFVTYMSDFHLGSPATNIQAFLDTTDLLMSDPRFYFIVVGPDLETAFAWFRSAEAVLNQTIPPWVQIEAYRHWLTDALAKALATCGDNHTDRRLERMLGDIGLTWREDLPYFRAYGRLKITLDNGRGDPVSYRTVMAHQYKGHSIYHKLQPAIRMMREIDPLADIYATAHTHSPFHMDGVYWAEEDLRPQGSRQHFVVAGTFKDGPEVYSLAGYGKPGVLGLPTFMLDPNEFRIVYFDSPEIALAVTNN